MLFEEHIKIDIDHFISISIPQFFIDNPQENMHSFFKDEFNTTFTSYLESAKKQRIKSIDIIKNEFLKNDFIKITHKIWITNPINMYKPDIKFINLIKDQYKNLSNYKHYFWCNIPSLAKEIINEMNIEENIKKCIIIKNLNELNDYYGYKLYNIYYNMKLYALACDIARIQIIHKYGGIYSDLGFSLKNTFSYLISNFDIVINGELTEQYNGYISHNILSSKKKEDVFFEDILNILNDDNKLKYYYKKYDLSGLVELSSPRIIMANLVSLSNRKFLSVSNNEHTFDREHNNSILNGKFGSDTLCNYDREKLNKYVFNL